MDECKQLFERIDKALVQEMPVVAFPGRIVVVQSAVEAERAVAVLSRQARVGFDTETRPCFRKGAGYMVSLVQLCGKNCAYLFRLDYCGGVPVLFPLFENPKILKVGVAVKDDVHHLKVRAPFDDAGFVDASRYTRAARIENTGLRALTAHFLGGRISKAAQVSNWAAKELSPQQIVYAATDAWVSRELFLKLRKLGIAPDVKSAGAIAGAEVPEPEEKAAAAPAPAPESDVPAGKKSGARPPRRRLSRSRASAGTKSAPAKNSADSAKRAA